MTPREEEIIKEILEDYVNNVSSFVVLLKEDLQTREGYVLDEMDFDEERIMTLIMIIMEFFIGIDGVDIIENILIDNLLC
jgi:hypothetical protein